MYESDATRFLRELKTSRPAIAQKQREGRALWWDHPQDQKKLAEDRESRVPQPAYVYATDP